MTTTPVVERVARAIADNVQAALPDDVRLDYDYAARAAIEAMREPTDEMVNAAWEHIGDPCWQEDVKRAWQAAIDAALGRGGE